MARFNLKQDITWHDILVSAALIIGAVAIIVWFMPRENRSNYKVEVGKLWRYTAFTAPFDFPIYKSEKDVKAERDSLMKQYEPYFLYDKEVDGRLTRQFVSNFSKGIPGLPADYISIIANRLHSLYSRGVMGSTEYSMVYSDSARKVRIVVGKNAVSASIAEVYSVKTAYERLVNDSLLTPYKAILQNCNLNDYIEPNLIYDKERSEASKNELLNSIPLSSGIVQRGQKIIDRGEIIDEKVHAIMESYKIESEKRLKDEAQINITIIGQICYTFILMLCFTLYLSLFRKDYFEKARNIFMLYSLIIFFAVLTSLMVSHNILHVYIVPFAMLPIFVRVFLDSRTAFMAHVTMVMICATILQHPLEFIALELVTGLVAIYSLRELSSRSQLFKTACIVAVTGIAINFSLDWITNNDVSKIDYSEVNYLIVNGVLLFCSYPLLYILEKTFGFTSNITLIELSDMNKELLRKMSEVAPGTFNHSIQVANLAAEIANRIGAKSQLVRTGALYHDIGKIINPIYFTENQSGINPHENISYVDSAQMIISHVTEGLKLAEKYNLPTEIRDFISTHHGQGKTKYFYVKYKNEHPDEEIDDLLFRYPGPNPFTKEQAILMMADTVEAASRSLPEYTEKAIRELVNKLVDAQVSDGFFRDCPITFRDIAYAKTVLIEKLKTIYHTRVSYPELKKTEN